MIGNGDGASGAEDNDDTASAPTLDQLLVREMLERELNSSVDLDNSFFNDTFTTQERASDTDFIANEQDFGESSIEPVCCLRILQKKPDVLSKE